MTGPRPLDPGNSLISTLLRMIAHGRRRNQQDKARREATAAAPGYVRARGVAPEGTVHNQLTTDIQQARPVFPVPPAAQYARDERRYVQNGLPGQVTNQDEIRAWYAQQEQDRAAKLEQTKQLIGTVLKEKLAPKNYDEASRALAAILSFDRDALENAPGTIIPELMVSLTLVPGGVQALRDVIMDVKGDDVGWYTALAAAGAFPLITPAMRTMRSVDKAARIAEETIRAREGGEEIMNLVHRTSADLSKGGMIVDPKFAGTGKAIKGAERGKGTAGSFYAPEGGYAEFRGLPEYTTQVPKKSLYPIADDPDGIFATTKTRTGAVRKLKENGYLGWISEDGNTVEIFQPLKVSARKQMLSDADNLAEGLAGAALAGGAAAMGGDEEGMDAASLILLAGTGGQVDPKFLRVASRTGREAQALARDVEAAGGVVMESRRLRADQLRKYLTADEAELLQRKGQMERFERAAKNLMAPEELINISLAGQGNRGGYQRTAQWFVDNFGEDAPVAIGFLAATSPRIGVAENTEMALDAFDTWVRLGRPRTAEGAAKVTRSVKGMKGTFGPNIERVLTAESLDDLYSVFSGPKVQSFGPNLAGDPSRVTNDTWMAVLHNIDPKYLGSAIEEPGTTRGLAGGDYLAANALTRAAGERFPGGAVPGREMQEMGWAGVKGLLFKFH